MFLQAPDIRFPGLGITFDNVPTGIVLPIGGGFEVKFYGIIIGLGILCGYMLACYCGRKAKITPDEIIDYLIYALIFSVMGARAYYVAFSWDYYSRHPLQIFNLRGGGLAIYGGVIVAFITLYVFTKKRKISFFNMADCCIPSLVTGQMMGRWGNFFNREAFGGYTDNVFAMCIRKADVYSGYITEEINKHTVIFEGEEYIQVHPTFLYESMWNFGVLMILLWVHHHKKFNGQIFWLYLLLYGLGRVWIEGLRTDQLTIGSTGIAVSQMLSAGMIAVSGVVLIVQMLRYKKSSI